MPFLWFLPTCSGQICLIQTRPDRTENAAIESPIQESVGTVPFIKAAFFNFRFKRHIPRAFDFSFWFKGLHDIFYHKRTPQQ
jgi:hypothetical protein